MGIPITELAEVIKVKTQVLTLTMDIIFKDSKVYKIVGEKAINPEHKPHYKNPRKRHTINYKF